MPFSLARQPLAPPPPSSLRASPSPHRLHSLGDSLSYFSVSVSFFVPLTHCFFFFFSGHPLSHDSLWIHWEAKAKKKKKKKIGEGGCNRSEQKERGDKLKTGQSLKLFLPSRLPSSPPSPASLCYVICLLPLSSDPPPPILLSLLSPQQWLTTCIVSSVTRGLISATHSVSVVWARSV